MNGAMSLFGQRIHCIRWEEATPENYRALYAYPTRRRQLVHDHEERVQHRLELSRGAHINHYYDNHANDYDVWRGDEQSSEFGVCPDENEPFYPEDEFYSEDEYYTEEESDNDGVVPIRSDYSPGYTRGYEGDSTCIIDSDGDCYDCGGRIEEYDHGQYEIPEEVEVSDHESSSEDGGCPIYDYSSDDESDGGIAL